MIKVGLTGGIGSGKTIIGKLFEVNNYPVFHADIVAKNILNSDVLIKQKMLELFGADIYLPDHTIDRKKLAALIFNDENLLKAVEAMVHPAVQRNFEEWSNRQNSSFSLYEAAILFESGQHKNMNFNILVIADEKIRINRVMQRDNCTEPQVLERIAKQWTDDKKQELADFIIHNNGGELLIPQVLTIIKKLE